MKTRSKCGAFALVASLVAAAFVPCRAEDYDLLKAKAEILVDQAKELYDDSCRKGSATHDASCRYWFGLMHATGTNVIARAKSPANERLMRKYVDLVGKDYEAYTKVSAATDMAAATGGIRGKGGVRHRAKRLINAEKLGDQELAAAIKRWESFAVQLKKK